MDEHFYHLADTLDLSNGPSPLLSLPRELRDEIYRLVLVPQANKPKDLTISHYSYKYTHPEPLDKERWLNTAILRTSRQIYQEASAILYDETVFFYNNPFVGLWYNGNNRHEKYHLCVLQTCSECPTVDKLPTTLMMSDTMARMRRVELYEYEYRPPSRLYCPTYIAEMHLIIKLFAKYATGLTTLRLNLTELQRWKGTTMRLDKVESGIPEALSTMTTLKTIDFQINAPTERGKVFVQMVERCAINTALLEGWTLRDLSTIEKRESRYYQLFDTNSCIVHHGRWLLTR